MTDHFLTIQDKRYDLENVDQLQNINVCDLPDEMVILLHDQFTTYYDEGAPSWLLGLITAWVRLEKDAMLSYQVKLDEKESVIRELKAQLNYYGD